MTTDDAVVHTSPDTDALLLRFALATTECPQPECPEKKHMGFEDTRPICESCGGTSRVPLVKGIRKECPNCKGSGKECSCGVPLRGEDSLPCGDVLPCHICQGRGWRPTTDPEKWARGLWPLLKSLLEPEETADAIVIAIQEYTHARVSGYDAEAWQAAAVALEGAELLEKETP